MAKEKEKILKLKKLIKGKKVISLTVDIIYARHATIAINTYHT